MVSLIEIGHVHNIIDGYKSIATTVVLPGLSLSNRCVKGHIKFLMTFQKTPTMSFWLGAMFSHATLEEVNEGSCVGGRDQTEASP